MKHLFFLVGLLCLTAAPISSFAQAQNAKDLRKERLEMLKASKSELNEKASKAAKKEAKKLQKEGWQTAPGALPLEKQLDKSYAMQYQYDESMYPMYIMGEAMSIGENYDGAKMQAMELAKQNLAAQIQTEDTILRVVSPITTTPGHRFRIVPICVIPDINIITAMLYGSPYRCYSQQLCDFRDRHSVCRNDRPECLGFCRSCPCGDRG